LNDLFQEIRKIHCLLITGFGFFFPDFSGDAFRHSHPNPFYATYLASLVAEYSTGTIFAQFYNPQERGF